MSDVSTVDMVLSQAGEREKEYDWLTAAEFYQKALGLLSPNDFLRMGGICEQRGFAFYRAAMQSENAELFRASMHRAVGEYEKARKFYASSNEHGKAAKTLRSDAMIAYIGYWLAPEVPEKKRLLHECWTLAKDALESFDQTADAFEYGKTFNQLATCNVFEFAFEWDFQVREKMMKEVIERGERTIALLSTLGDSNELTKAYAKTAVFIDAFIQRFLDLDEQENAREKALGYWAKAVKLSKEIAMLELLSDSVQVDHENIGWDLATDETLQNFKIALDYAERTRDNFMIGRALDWLVYHAAWKATAIENRDDEIELLKTVSQYSEEANRKFSHISFTSPRGDLFWIEAPLSHYNAMIAQHETDLKKRRELYKQALEADPEMLKRAEDSGYPDIIKYAQSSFSFALLRLAEIETNSDEKKRLLEKALAHRIETSRISEQLEPYDYWDRGLDRATLAEIRWNLAELTEDSESKKNMLTEAITDAENSLQLCAKHANFYERSGFVKVFSILGFFQYQLGTMLNRLFESTGDKSHLRKAAEMFAEGAKSFQKLNLTSRMAECYWKAAESHDKLGEHLKATDNFDIVSNKYKETAEKIPQLKDFYLNYAAYMQAWKEIEKARHHHKRQEYGLAEEHFNEAARLHKSLKQWSYIAPNYYAWAQVEHAEDLSRNEQSEEALLAFEKAAGLFIETKTSLQTQLSKIEDLNQKQEATNMAKASELRHQYCVGRIALEDAKILDKKGDHSSSSEKYGSAAEIFQKITQAQESEQDRKEFKLIAILSEAWQKMTQAEAEESSNLYLEAAQLFDEAKELSPTEKARILALGHSHFCRALEVGTRFADTRDATLYVAFIQHLESAANYYVKAGFQNAAEYAKATKLLFDGYVHMDNAQKENDPEKKAKLYTIAEKVLQTSAGAYMKAEHPEKREQVLRLLDRVKEERELAISLSEVLHAPSIVSTTTAFATPQPTQENAVGLERFEHADIQANIIAHQKELKVGENLDLEIELTNTGKGAALLTKITKIIPEGFELKEKPENYRVEDNNINMKGKRLEPLKTEEIRFILNSKMQGEFSLEPKILYLDENGKYKSHEPEPITITVKELGIKAWLRGER